MSQVISQSPLDQHQEKIQSWVDLGWNNTQIASELTKLGVSTTRDSVRRAKKRWGVNYTHPSSLEPSLEIHGDTARIVTDVYDDSKSVEQMVIDSGLSPEEFQVDKPRFIMKRVNGKIMQQADITLKRMKPFDLIVPARIPMENPPKKTYRRPQSSDRPKLWVFVGDEQAPYQDRHLCDMFNYVLEEHKPDFGVLNGDGIDFETLSKHPDNPDQRKKFIGDDDPVQAGIDSYANEVKDRVDASPNTLWRWVEGNHDYRFRSHMIDNALKQYNITKARFKGEPVHAPEMRLTRYLRFDELGVENISTESGNWKHDQFAITPDLVVKHSDTSRPRSGDSVKPMLDKATHSWIVSHNHRQGIVHKTRTNAYGKPIPTIGVEIGCMCIIAGGLDYTPGPDWMNGFATAWVWPDNKFKIDLGTYIDGVLYYGDKRYS